MLQARDRPARPRAPLAPMPGRRRAAMGGPFSHAGAARWLALSGRAGPFLMALSGRTGPPVCPHMRSPGLARRKGPLATRWCWHVPPPPPRTKWSRRVPHPVLIGHAASLAPYKTDTRRRRRATAPPRSSCWRGGSLWGWRARSGRSWPPPPPPPYCFPYPCPYCTLTVADVRLEQEAARLRAQLEAERGKARAAADAAAAGAGADAVDAGVVGVDPPPPPVQSGHVSSIPPY